MQPILIFRDFILSIHTQNHENRQNRQAQLFLCKDEMQYIAKSYFKV